MSDFTDSKYDDAKLALMEFSRGINLFDHQRKAVLDTFINLRKWRLDGTHRYQRQIGVSPTGSGKTVIMFSVAHMYTHLIREITGSKGRVLILVHTKSLMYQIADRAIERWGYHKVGMLGDDVNTVRQDSELVIAIVQSLGGDNPRTMNRRLARLGTFSLVIVDECHRAVTEMHGQAITKFVVGKTALLGVTATFERSDSVPMSKIFTHTAFVVQPLQLRKGNFIANPNYHYPTYPNGNPRYKQVGKNEYTAWSHYYKAWLRIGGDQMKTIVFTDTKKNAKAIYEYMRKRGHNCGYVIAETPTEERDYIAQNCDVIVNINTMTEGTDIDGLQCAILTHVSRVNTLFYTQRGGRVMRPDWEDGLPIHKDAHIIAPVHHDLLATIPLNVIDVNNSWLDLATRNLATYLDPEEEALINSQLDDIQGDITITEEMFDNMPTLAQVVEARKPKPRKTKKPEPKVWYYDSNYDRTRQRRQRTAAKRRTTLSKIKSIFSILF